MIRPLLSSLALSALLFHALPPAVTADHSLETPAKSYTENFEDKTVASVKSPTDLYFTPDNQYAFVTSKFGTLWRVAVADMDNNKGQAEKVFEIPHPMCLNGARGLAGVAVHPDYPAVRHIYLFHNHDKVSFGRSVTSRVERMKNLLVGLTQLLDGPHHFTHI